MTPVPAKSPSAIVSHSHCNPGWTAEQERERRQQVHRFVAALRTYGIDADADIFHENEDWTRWGQGQVDASEFVLIVVSEAWKNAWVGAGDPVKSKGVRAEANAVKEHRAAGWGRRGSGRTVWRAPSGRMGGPGR